MYVYAHAHAHAHANHGPMHSVCNIYTVVYKRALLYKINSMCAVDIKCTCKFNENLATHSYANSSSTVKHILLLKVLKCWVSCGLQIGLC